MNTSRTFPLCVSLLLLVSGCVILSVWPMLFDYILTSQLVLKQNSQTYEVWKKVPFPMHMEFYFFNWTNPQDIYNASSKPKFQQMGPYRYKEEKEKANVTWNENGTVSYRLLNSWYFDDPQVNKEYDRVTTLNPIALTAATVARDWSYLVKKGLSFSLNAASVSINITRTVKELLFHGYEDPLIQMGKSMPILPKTALPPWDKFGWFYTRNGTTTFDGTFNMGTGYNNTEFGRLYEWNYRTQTPFFPGECGKIKGAAGELFQRNPTKDFLTIFSQDLCRHVTLDYVGETNVANVLGYKYTAADSMLDNGTLIPENKCFCGGDCVPSGAMNVSACRFGSPSFASLPHFYNGDPYYINSVEGLHPEEKKHEFSMTLEPTTGIPLEVNARMQINLLMRPVRGVQLFDGVPNVFFPMLWFEKKVQIPDDLAFKLKLLLNLPIICTSTGIILIFVGLILMSCVIYKMCTTNLCGKKKERYIYEEQHLPLKLNKNKPQLVRNR